MLKSLVLVPLLAIVLFSPIKSFFKWFARPATAAEQVAHSVLKITGWELDESQEYVCTAFVIAPERVLTAAHCLGLEMYADGEPAEILKQDQWLDLALLKVNTHRKPVTLRSTPVSRFETLTGIGYGYGWETLLFIKQELIVTNYHFPEDQKTPVGLIVRGGYIGGMSGGPVVDEDGLVVGIIQRSHGDTGYGVGTLLIQGFLLGTEQP